jgi:hypothetical protein
VENPWAIYKLKNHTGGSDFIPGSTFFSNREYLVIDKESVHIGRKLLISHQDATRYIFNPPESANSFTTYKILLL